MSSNMEPSSNNGITIAPTGSKKSAEASKLPTFDPTWIVGGSKVPDGTFALALPAEMIQAYRTGAILRSKGGEGASASACYLGTPPALTIPRLNGSAVDVTVKLSAYTGPKDAQPACEPINPAERAAALRRQLADLEAQM